MNILEICLSQSLGGLELYFYKTCQKLREHHSILRVVRSGSRLEHLGRKDSGTFLSLQSGNLIIQSLFLLKLISRKKIDVVHVHHKNDILLCALVKFLSRRKFKLVHTRQMALPRKKKDLYHRLIYSQIDLLIVISKALEQVASKNLPIHPGKIKLLYYGASVSDPGKSPFEAKSKDQFKVGIFSRIEFKKGQHLLLEAIDLLNRKGYHLLAHIYGDVMEQNYYDNLCKYISSHNTGNIYFKGFHQNPASVMHYYDAVVVPSLNETFGLVAIEAMLSKTAVIGSGSGGLPEIIDHGETGLLFEPENAKSLASQLEWLIRNPAFRTEIAENGHKRARQMFDEGVHYKRLAEMIENF